MVRTRALIERAAASDASVVITGESGTGKELVARALHRGGRRAAGPFVAMNCAAVPEALLESELFGYLRGAFTDAKAARRGLFHEADGGTLFLDEIGEMSPRIQPKLLRALQERTARPLGGTAEIPFDVRLVAATNEDHHAAVAERRFRSDLFYRHNVVPIEVPPLRARGDDIALLARRFAAVYAARHGKHITGLSPEAIELLREPTLGRATCASCRTPSSAPSPSATARPSAWTTLPEHLRGVCPPSPGGWGPPALRAPRSLSLLPPSTMPAPRCSRWPRSERRHVLRVLAAVDGNKRLAARILGLDRRTLYRRLDQYQGRS